MAVAAGREARRVPGPRWRWSPAPAGGSAPAWLSTGRAGIPAGALRADPPAVPPGCDAVAAAVDVADAAALDGLADAVVARFGRIDLWVNSAGVLGPVGALADVARGPGAPRRHQRPRHHARLGHLRPAPPQPTRWWGAGQSLVGSGEPAVPGLGGLLRLEGGGRDAHRGGRAGGAGLGPAGLRGVPGGGRHRHAGGGPVRPESVFPDAARFRGLHRDGALATPAWVARCIVERCVDPATRLEPGPIAGRWSSGCPISRWEGSRAPDDRPGGRSWATGRGPRGGTARPVRARSGRSAGRASPRCRGPALAWSGSG